MAGNVLFVDKKTEFGKFRYEERIKSPQYQAGIDYEVDENGSMYTIFSSQLKRDILLTQNSFNDNINVDEISSMRILVDRQEEINIKPKLVLDMEKREKLIDTGKRGINIDFTRALPSSESAQLIENEENNSSRIREIDGSEDAEMDEVENSKETKDDRNTGGGGGNKYFTPFTGVSFLLFILALV